MYPHERSLVKKLEGKPFVILGVNSDHDRAALKKVITDQGITWQSFWDGGGTEGPIATRWNVHSWPTVYLLDAKGVIRYKRPVGADVKLIDAQIEKLLEELGPAAGK
jgi:hypothetical protein